MNEQLTGSVDGVGANASYEARPVLGRVWFYRLTLRYGYAPYGPGDGTIERHWGVVSDRWAIPAIAEDAVRRNGEGVMQTHSSQAT
jgi:hypothetical protein